MIKGKVPPHSPAFEASILSSLLIDNSAWYAVKDVVRAGDFYDIKYRTIFAEMQKILSSGSPLDPQTLGTALVKAGVLRQVGGAMIISKILDSRPIMANVSHYAKQVRELSGKRKILEIAMGIVESGFNDDDSLGALGGSINALKTAHENLIRGNTTDTIFQHGDSVMELYNKVESGYRGIPLPWPTLDGMTSGLWPKTVSTFVARPGVGKTQMGVIITRFAWMQGKRVLFISPEMSKESIAERFFVIHAELPYGSVVAGTLGLDKAVLEKTIEDLRFSDGAYIMDFSDDLTVDRMYAAAKACAPDLLVLDSIYDIHMKGERKDKALAAMEFLKRASRELNCAAIGLAQQNRGAEVAEKFGGGNRLGTIALADEIGQDSHAVFSLEQDKDDKADRVLYIRPLKLRRGWSKVQRLKVNWDFDRMNFSEIPEGSEDGFADKETAF